MAISKKKISTFLLFYAIFFTFSGYYLVLMIWNNIGLIQFSRYVTIPLKVISVIFLFGFFLLSKKQQLNKYSLWFFFFCFLYMFRIFIEYLKGNDFYHIGLIDFFLYFLMYVFLPGLFLIFSKLSKENYNTIFKSLLWSCLFFGLASLFFYSTNILFGGRISEMIDKSDNYISPLAMSYSGAMGLILSLSVLMDKNNKIISNKFAYIILFLSVIPLVLGASRGSIFALFIPLLVKTIYSGSFKNKYKSIINLFFVAIFIFIIVSFTGSSLLDRFFSISNDIDVEKSSTIRLVIWADSINQFLQNPFFGNSLESSLVKTYPHNLLIESLLSTGLLGSSFLLILVFKSFKLIKKNISSNKNIWISFIFIQGLMQLSFSGAIYFASWFFIPLIILIKTNESSYKL